jgi:uncharacterized protein YaaQ
MSLLLVAIVHLGDADRVVGALGTAGYRVTRLLSMGGYLGTENATLLVGIDAAQEPEVLGIFERECAPRDIEVPLVLLGRLKDEFPRSVHYGGATIFILDVRGMLRIEGAASG